MDMDSDEIFQEADGFSWDSIIVDDDEDDDGPRDENVTISLFITMGMGYSCQNFLPRPWPKPKLKPSPSQPQAVLAAQASTLRSLSCQKPSQSQVCRPSRAGTTLPYLDCQRLNVLPWAMSLRAQQN